jgi:cytochrome c peroxidase
MRSGAAAGDRAAVKFDRRTVAGVVLSAALSGCTEEPAVLPYEGPPLPWDYQAFPLVIEPLDNPTTEEKVSLGLLLFYDPILSGDERTACATCHSEQWGFSDGLALSVGVEGEGPTGPGRDGPHQTTRNAPTLWNVVFRDSYFWDGRRPSLESQALDPLENEVELNLKPALAVAKLRANPTYVELFDAAFPQDSPSVTEENLAKALAAFQRTLITRRAPYDQYVAGDEGALSADGKKGMALFAEAGCANCHVPPLFDSERFEQRIDSDDDGRYAVTKQPADRGKMRVPTLRNLRETGPFFHDGSSLELEDAVLREVETAAARAEGRALSKDEAALISVFLRKALMSRANEPTRPDEVPSGLAVPLDGFRIPR